MNLLFLTLLAGCICCASGFFGLTQSTKVTGRVFCGDKPAANVKVKLEEYDRGPDPDDNLDSGYTDSDGRFTLQGSTKELSTIDPRLKIFHDCNDYMRPCQKLWVLTVPDKYVTRSKTPAKTMDFGNMNLEVELDDKERDCLH